METWPRAAQFLELGPEILTRDLEEARQNTYQVWKDLLIFMFFVHLLSDFVYPENFRLVVCRQKNKKIKRSFHTFFGEILLNHVSTFQVLTTKIERCVAILVTPGFLGRPSS